MNIQKLPYSELTPLCEIMKEHNCDKSPIAWKKRHNYTLYYHSLFENIRDKEINFFELGLGSHNKKYEYIMHPSYKTGASVYGWRDYFPKGQIYGADIDSDILFQEERIHTFFCDQTSPESITDMWRKMNDVNFDVILEDGLHSFDANRTFFENSHHKLKVGGVFIIEDILRSNIESNWKNQIEQWKKKYLGYEFKIVEMETLSESYDDNNLIVIQKKK